MVIAWLKQKNTLGGLFILLEKCMTQVVCVQVSKPPSSYKFVLD